MKMFFTDLRSALMFITILPAGKNAAWSPVGMIKCFPLVGMILGTLLFVFDWMVSCFWPAGVAAVLDVIFLVLLTGAFHLDGLGDAADGLFSHRSKERAMEIMKDSRTGMMGLVVIFCILAVKIAGVYALKTMTSGYQTLLCFFLIPAYARATMVFGIRFLDYGRTGTGTGLDLFQTPIGVKDFMFVAILVAVSLVLGYKGLVLNLGFIITMAVILGFYKAKLGCITGDMLGAMCEVTEAILFLLAGAALLT